MPATDARFDYGTVFPPIPGFRYEIFHVMPDSVRAGLPALSPEQLAKDLDEKFPGLRDHLPEASGMHTTPTVDLGIVLDGEIVLELDDGAETLLTRGDSYVMNGTRHAWHNRTDQVTVMAVVLVGAQQTDH